MEQNSTFPSQWQREIGFFRALHLIKHSPGTATYSFLSGLHRYSHHFVRFLTTIMIILLAIAGLKHLATATAFTALAFEPTRLAAWKVFRNALYIFLLLEFLFVAAPLFAVNLLQGRFARGVRIFLSWAKTFAFLTFSYALSGLVIDILFLLIFISFSVSGGESDGLLKVFLSLFSNL